MSLIQKCKVLGIIGLSLLNGAAGLASQQSPDSPLKVSSVKNDDLAGTTIVMGGVKTVSFLWLQRLTA